jgi:hypothetical protein
MSTKTSIKRIALVAAAALTLGGFSVITASSAHAAASDVAGVGVSASTYTSTTVSALTAGTSSALPAVGTVVAKTKFHLGVKGTATAAETITAYSDAAFSTNLNTDTATFSTVTTITTGSDVLVTAPGTPGTYYYTITNETVGGATTTAGYLKLTVVDLLAVTYDGTIAGIGSTAVNGVAGVSNTVTLSVGRNASGGKAGYLSVTGAGATISSISTGQTVATGATTATIAAGLVESHTVVVNTPTAGTVTVTYAPESAAGSGLAGSVTDTVVITVNATGSAGVLSVANSTLYDSTTDATAVASLTAPSALATSGTWRVRYDFSLKDALKAAKSLSSTTIGSVVVTGPGLVGTANTSGSAAKAVSFTSGSTGTFYLFGDGTSGVSTITFSVGSTVIATKSVTFYSNTVATLAATVNHGIVNSAAVTGWYADSGTAGALSFVSVVAKDANGNVIPNASNVLGLTASSASTSIATAGTPAYDSTDLVTYIPVSGVAKGSTVITVKDSTGLISATATINVAKAVIDTWSVAFGAGTYNPGDAATIVISAKDSDGNAVADGYYTNALAGSFSSSQALTASLFSSTLHFVNGSATASFYAPYNAGVLTVNVKGGSSTTVLGSAIQKVVAADSTVLSATASINGSDSSSLAYDAASAATDAANNAYEEAQNATQAASDALAAVKALAVQVKALIALVNKIKAKIGA